MSERINGASVSMKLPPVEAQNSPGARLPDGYHVHGISLESVVSNRGGSAVVFRGRHIGREWHPPVAVKVAKEDMQDPALFVNEVVINTVLRGKSGHLVQMLDHGVGVLPDGSRRKFIEMEYLPDGSVSDQLERHGALPATRAVRYASQTAEGLHVMHEDDLLHGDVKPANMFLNGAIVKLGDFGTARPFNQTPLTLEVAGEQLHLEPERTGFLLGSPRYMAPEQAEGWGGDARTDVRGIALATYEMLMGLPFFDITDNREQLERLVNPDEYDAWVKSRMQDLNNMGYGAFEDPINRAVNRILSKRFSDPRAFATDLRERLAQMSDDAKDSKKARTIFVVGEGSVQRTERDIPQAAVTQAIPIPAYAA